MPCLSQAGTIALDAAIAEIVEHLVAGERVRVERRLAANVVDVEVAHTEETGLAGGDELLHRPHGLAERARSAPVQQVQVEIIGCKPAQAASQALIVPS